MPIQLLTHHQNIIEGPFLTKVTGVPCMLVSVISILHIEDTRIKKKNIVNYLELSGLNSFAVTFKVSQMLAKLNQLIYCLN